MPKPLAEGDRIRIVDREPVAADVKSQLFYEHYRNMTGVVRHIYADGTAAVNVDSDALAKDMAKRHADISEANRQKWLDAISDEQRNKLSSSEKSFALRYTVLVSTSDVVPISGSEKPIASTAKAAVAAPPAEPARKTLAEIEAEEARHLEEIRSQAKP